MQALDVATPMGVIITAGTFLEGATAIRRQTVLSDLPRAWASVLPPGKKWTELASVPQVPGVGTATVALALLALNWVLFVAGWSLDGKRVTLPVLLLGAFVLAHAVIVASGYRDLRDGRAAAARQRDNSAYFTLLDANHVEVPGAEHPGRIAKASEAVGLYETALARVPPGVADGTYRMALADARVRLAEAYLDQRRPQSALGYLDLADAEANRQPGWLDAYGAHDSADFIADLGIVRRAELRARAERMMGHPAAEFDAWLTALRSAPSQMPSHAEELVEAARRSSRMDELEDALFSIVDESLELTTWGEDLLTRVAVHLQDLHRRGCAELGVLRLLHALRATDDIADSLYALHLVNALLATGTVDDLCEAQALLIDVDIARSRRWVDQWARAHIVASIRQGDKDAAFCTLLTWIGEDPAQWSIAGFREWADMAQAWGRLDDLASWVDARERKDDKSHKRVNMFARRLKDRPNQDKAGFPLP